MDIHAHNVLCDRDVALHGLRNDGGSAGDDANIRNDEMGVVVAQVMEYERNGPAVLILEIAVLVRRAAVSLRKMMVLPVPQPELLGVFFSANVAAQVLGSLSFSSSSSVRGAMSTGFT